MNNWRLRRMILDKFIVLLMLIVPSLSLNAQDEQSEEAEPSESCSESVASESTQEALWIGEVRKVALSWFGSEVESIDFKITVGDVELEALLTSEGLEKQLSFLETQLNDQVSELEISKLVVSTNEDNHTISLLEERTQLLSTASIAADSSARVRRPGKSYWKPALIVNGVLVLGGATALLVSRDLRNEVSVAFSGPKSDVLWVVDYSNYPGADVETYAQSTALLWSQIEAARDRASLQPEKRDARVNVAFVLPGGDLKYYQPDAWNLTEESAETFRRYLSRLQVSLFKYPSQPGESEPDEPITFEPATISQLRPNKVQVISGRAPKDFDDLLSDMQVHAETSAEFLINQPENETVGSP